MRLSHFIMSESDDLLSCRSPYGNLPKSQTDMNVDTPLVKIPSMSPLRLKETSHSDLLKPVPLSDAVVKSHSPTAHFSQGVIPDELVEKSSLMVPAGTATDIMTNALYDYQKLQDSNYGTVRDYHDKVGSVILEKKKHRSVLQSKFMKKVVADNYTSVLNEKVEYEKKLKKNQKNHDRRNEKSTHKLPDKNEKLEVGELIYEETGEDSLDIEAKATAVNCENRVAAESTVRNKIQKIVDVRSNAEVSRSTKAKSSIPKRVIKNLVSKPTAASRKKHLRGKVIYHSQLDVLAAQIATSPYNVHPMAPYSSEYLKQIEEIHELKYSMEKLAVHKKGISKENVILQDGSDKLASGLSRLSVSNVEAIPDAVYDSNNKPHLIVSTAIDNEVTGTGMINAASSPPKIVSGRTPKAGSLAGSFSSKPPLGPPSMDLSSHGSVDNSIASAKKDIINIAHDTMSMLEKTNESVVRNLSRSKSVSRIQSKPPTRINSSSTSVDSVNSNRSKEGDIFGIVNSLNMNSQAAQPSDDDFDDFIDGMYKSSSLVAKADNNLIDGSSIDSGKSCSKAGSMSSGIAVEASSCKSGEKELVLAQGVAESGEKSNLDGDLLPSDLGENSCKSLQGTQTSTKNTSGRKKEKDLEKQFMRILLYNNSYARSKMVKFEPLQRKALPLKDTKAVKDEKKLREREALRSQVNLNKQQRAVAVENFERGRDSIRSSMYGRSYSELSLSLPHNSNVESLERKSPIQEAIQGARNDYMEGIFDDLDSDEDESAEYGNTAPNAVGTKERRQDACFKQLKREFSRKEVKNCMLNLLSSNADSRLNREMDEGVRRPASANSGGIVRRSVNPPGDHPYIQRSYRYNDMVTTGVFVDHRRKGWGLDWSHDMKRATVNSHSPVSEWKRAALEKI